MKIQNHYKIGCIIFKKLADNDMTLNKLAFIFGNLAPDLFLSFLYRPHLYTFAGPYVKKLLLRLYKSGASPACTVSSFYLGMISHYVCDFFCYTHTPAFKGNIREHLLYEIRQKVNVQDILPFYKQKSMNLGHAQLMDTLEHDIAKHEAFFLRNAKMAYMDIPVAIYKATWATAAVYLQMEKAMLHQDANVAGGKAPASDMVA